MIGDDRPASKTPVEHFDSFRHNLEHLINNQSMENGGNTPDFILAQYLTGCLENFDRTMLRRDQWFNKQVVGLDE